MRPKKNLQKKKSRREIMREFDKKRRSQLNEEQPNRLSNKFVNPYSNKSKNEELENIEDFNNNIPDRKSRV